MPSAPQLTALKKFSELFHACWIMDGPRGARRLLPRPDREHHADLTRIESAAEQLAAAEHRAPLEKDLRHACTLLALGKLKSTKNFTDDEARAVTDFLIGVLDPLDLALAQRRADPQAAKKSRMLYVLKTHALQGYVVSESLRLYDTKIFETLPWEKFLSLFKHLHARPAAWKPGHYRAQKNNGRAVAAAPPKLSPVPDGDWPDELPSASDNPF